MSLDWSKVRHAMGDEDPIVKAARLARPREVVPGHDETVCASCGQLVKLANFVCPHCNGTVRRKQKSAEHKATRSVNAGGVALWSAVGVLAVIAVALCIQFGYLNVIDDRYSNEELKSIAVGMSRADVVTKFGEPTTTALVIGNSEAVQWIRGHDEDLSSIAVVFVDGKVKEVIGTNLR